MMPPAINTSHTWPHAVAKATQGERSIIFAAPTVRALLESRSKLRRALPPQSEVEIKDAKS